MKKILIGAILASSFAMSGTLEECTDAVIKRLELEKAKSHYKAEEKYWNNQNISYTMNKMGKEAIDSAWEQKQKYWERALAVSSLSRLWDDVIQSKCKGVLEGSTLKNL